MSRLTGFSEPRYEVHLVGDPEMSVIGCLAQPVRYRTDSLEDAKSAAIALSSEGPWGAAVVDAVSRTIDFGDHVKRFDTHA